MPMQRSSTLPWASYSGVMGSSGVMRGAKGEGRGWLIPRWEVVQVNPDLPWEGLSMNPLVLVTKDKEALIGKTHLLEALANIIA